MPKLIPSEALKSRPDTALAQTIHLPTYREGKYLGFLYVRAPERVGRIRVALTGLGERARQTYALTALTASTYRQINQGLPPPAGSKAVAMIGVSPLA